MSRLRTLQLIVKKQLIMKKFCQKKSIKKKRFRFCLCVPHKSIRLKISYSFSGKLGIKGQFKGFYAYRVGKGSVIHSIFYDSVLNRRIRHRCVVYKLQVILLLLSVSYVETKKSSNQTLSYQIPLALKSDEL